MYSQTIVNFLSVIFLPGSQMLMPSSCSMKLSLLHKLLKLSPHMAYMLYEYVMKFLSSSEPPS